VISQARSLFERACASRRRERFLARNYWTEILSSSISRRRALTASSDATAAAVLLAACGSGNKARRSETKDGSGLLSKPVDSSAKAVPGGVWRSYTGADITTLDPHANNSGGA